MGKIFVHIGLPKTATSTLQIEVFPRLQDDKLIYLGVDGYRRPGASSDLYHQIMFAVEHGCGFDHVKTLLEAFLVQKDLLLSEELLTVSDSKELTWRKKLENLSRILNGLDYFLIVTVREPASALFSYYVELFKYNRFFRDEEGFVFLAKNREEFEIFHYEKLIDFLFMYFDRNRLFFYKFEDIVNAWIDPLCYFVTSGRKGWDSSFLAKHNGRKVVGNLVYTGKYFTLVDYLKKLVYFLGVEDSFVFNQLKSRLKPIVKILEMVSIHEKIVQKPSEHDLRELRLFLRSGITAIDKHFGIKYE